MFKRTKKALGVMVLIGLLSCLACSAAFAYTDPSTDVDIYTGSTYVDNLTSTELNTLGTVYRVYSTHKCNGHFYNDYSATGPKLLDVLIYALNDANIYNETTLLNAYSKINFISTENGVTIDYQSGVIDLDDVLNGLWFEYVDDDLEDGIPVDAIIATSGDDHTLRNFHGQQAPTDNTAEDWTKHLDRMVLSN